MGTEAARQVRDGLAELIRLVNDPATPTSDLKVVLSECKAFGGKLAVLQADAAAGVAGRERHGDSGVGVLARAAGLSRHEAASQVKTTEQLQSMPRVRDAVESGLVSFANAKVLAGTGNKTSAEQVESDTDLLEKATALTPEQFAKEAGRWAVKRQEDGGEGEYRRQRARRRLSIWDGDDGMVHLRGELDPVTGAKVRKRFVLEVERLRRADLHSPGGEKRSLNQRMADALDTLTSHGSIHSNAESATPSGHSRASTGAAANDGSGVDRAREGGSVGGVGDADTRGVSVGGVRGDAGTRGLSVGGVGDVGTRAVLFGWCGRCRRWWSCQRCQCCWWVC